MDDLCKTILLECADAFCAATQQARATVARKAAGDWRFFDRLDSQAGRSFGVQKYDAIMDWFLVHWPDRAPKPQALQDHADLRRWEAANSYSVALERGDPVPRVIVPAKRFNVCLPGDRVENRMGAPTEPVLEDWPGVSG